MVNDQRNWTEILQVALGSPQFVQLETLLQVLSYPTYQLIKKPSIY